MFDYPKLGLPVPDVQVSFEDALGAGGQGDGARYTPGVSGQGVWFEDGGSAAWPVGGETLLGYPLTISLWVAIPEGAEISHGGSYVFQWGHIPGIVVRVNGTRSQSPAGSLAWEVTVSNGRSAADKVTNVGLTRGLWHHLVLVIRQYNIFGGARVTSYLNGTSLGESHYNGGLLNITHIDRPEFFGAGKFDGSVMVDEIGIWKEVLTDQQVETLFRAGERAVSIGAGAQPSGWGVLW